MAAERVVASPIPARARRGERRITAAGVPDFHDYVFFTDPIPAGETRSFSQTVPPLPSGQALPAGTALAVRCN
jgi:hypothetical protein